jgi:hypothetical protein
MVQKEKAPSDLLLSCFSNPIRLSFRLFVRYSARNVFQPLGTFTVIVTLLENNVKSSRDTSKIYTLKVSKYGTIAYKPL